MGDVAVDKAAAGRGKRRPLLRTRSRDSRGTAGLATGKGRRPHGRPRAHPRGSGCGGKEEQGPAIADKAAGRRWGAVAFLNFLRAFLRQGGGGAPQRGPAATATVAAVAVAVAGPRRPGLWPRRPVEVEATVAAAEVDRGGRGRDCGDPRLSAAAKAAVRAVAAEVAAAQSSAKLRWMPTVVVDALAELVEVLTAAT